jgi:hypothetical protein
LQSFKISAILILFTNVKNEGGGGRKKGMRKMKGL